MRTSMAMAWAPVGVGRGCVGVRTAAPAARGRRARRQAGSGRRCGQIALASRHRSTCSRATSSDARRLVAHVSGEPWAHRIDSRSGSRKCDLDLQDGERSPRGLSSTRMWIRAQARPRGAAGQVGSYASTTVTSSSVTSPSTIRNERNWKGPSAVSVRGGHQDVVRAGLVGVGDVGARGVGLGRGVRVVDDHRLLVAVVHVAVELQQVGGVELVERGRAGRVQHRDEPLGAAAARRARDHAARLVGVVGARVLDDLVVQGLGDGQHGARISRRARAYRASGTRGADRRAGPSVLRVGGRAGRPLREGLPGLRALSTR